MNQVKFDLEGTIAI